MEVKAKFDHFNVNVTDLNRSIEFYSKALGFTEARRKEAADGSFVLVYLTDGVSPFLLELTWLRDHKEAYELGENERDRKSTRLNSSHPSSSRMPSSA